jgi:hypothetical protein
MAVKTRPEVGSDDGRGRTPIGKQVNVRIPPALLADLQLVADDAALDISAVVRMVLSQNVEVYVRQVRERRQRQGAGQRREG